VALLVTAGCSGGGDSPTIAGNSPPAPQPTSQATPPLTIKITSFRPSGTNVKVGFQATNHATGDVKFNWERLVLTAPDGSKHTASRPAAVTSQTILGKGWTITHAGTFQFPKLKHGKYVISYAGTPLQTKTL
jgi:hypothetical protein